MADIEQRQKRAQERLQAVVDQLVVDIETYGPLILPPGDPGDAFSCPVAEALRTRGVDTPSVGPLGIFSCPSSLDGPWVMAKMVPLPSVVSRFLVRFDSGLYPELEDKNVR